MKPQKHALTRRTVSFLLALLLLLGALSACSPHSGNSGTTDKSSPNTLVIGVDSLDGTFHPFFSESDADKTVTGLTQLSFLSTGYENGASVILFGDGEASVVKDFDTVYDEAADETRYTFVLKNGITFSDGEALTVQDVLFSLYVLLDPLYDGSISLSSLDIVGVSEYRTQTRLSGDTNVEALLSSAAVTRSENRLRELITLFRTVSSLSEDGAATESAMRAAIAAHTPQSGYTEAIPTGDAAPSPAQQLLQDYAYACTLYRDALLSDYDALSGAYTGTMYASFTEFSDPVFCFLYAKGYVEAEYNSAGSAILSLTPRYNTEEITDKESAVAYVYADRILHDFPEILETGAVSNALKARFTAEATERLLSEKRSDDGSLSVPNIAGIISLGHSTDITEVTVNGNCYTVSHTHGTDGSPSSAEEYDVLTVTLNGRDRGAIFEFDFPVLPQHYYAEGAIVDIEGNRFGTAFASYYYMTEVICSERNESLPMGAGPYEVSVEESDTADTGAFRDTEAGTLLFERNDTFLLGAPKIEFICCLTVSSSPTALKDGTVHFASLPITQSAVTAASEWADSSIVTLTADAPFYGYIGINAETVSSIYLRKAIMSAMNISLACSYYGTDMTESIFYPLSTASYAYPKDENGNPLKNNLHPFPTLNYSKSAAVALIKQYMSKAGVNSGDHALTLTFTVAASSVSKDPAYEVLRAAAKVLNECGWNVTLAADRDVLSKLDSGTVAVFAAVRSVPEEPEFFEIYHMYSGSGASLGFGYGEILAHPSRYPEEYALLSSLSAVLDEAEAEEDRTARASLYEQAMGYILDLAIELPVYACKTLYAYDSAVIDSATLPSEIDPYASPLARIWEIEFADATS